jgi:hypothetical protein
LHLIRICWSIVNLFNWQNLNIFWFHRHSCGWTFFMVAFSLVRFTSFILVFWIWSFWLNCTITFLFLIV